MAAECLRTLAHPVRLRIVELLLQGQYTVGELAEECGIRPNVASEHLRLMEMCGLLTKEREGRRIYYEAAHECLDHILDCIRCQFNT
jgi:DNA-binding transcriptional ArsR family regulator